MPLDPRRLARDAKILEAKRPAGTIGRESTGITRAIRALMPTIRELREGGVRWAAIAEALARQGVVGLDGGPLKANRLTAVVDRIGKGERKVAEKTLARRTRQDVANLGSSVFSPDQAIPERQDQPSRAGPEHRTAEQIRRDGLSDLDAILKGTKR